MRFSAQVTLTILSGLVAVAASIHPAQSQQSGNAPVLSYFVDGETRFTSWSGSRGQPITLPVTPGSRARGHLWYTTVGGRTVYAVPGFYTFELTGRAGYFGARQSLPGVATSTLNAPSDVLLSSKVSFHQFGWFQPYLSASVNLPTGKALLTPAQRYARMDRDLVGVSGYGEGLTIAATLGSSFALTESIAASLAVTGTFADTYRRDVASAIGIQVAPVTQSFNPGESITLAAGLAGSHGAVSWALNSSYTIEDRNRANGQVVTRIGHAALISGNAGLRWAENALLAMSASYQSTRKNEVVPAPPGALLQEAFNSNADVLSLGIDQWVQWQTWTFGAGTSYRKRFANDWPVGDQRYIAGRDRIGVSLAAKRQMTDALDLTVKLERFWLRYDAQPVAMAGPTPIPNSSAPATILHGWQIALGAGMKF